MSFVVPIALFGWPLVVIALFATMRARIAAMIAFLGAWLFLPMAVYQFSGLPNYGKMEAAAYGALLGMLVFDFSRIQRFRPGIVDIPMLVWCLTPLASSLANGLGIYDGISSVYGQTISWGVPYLMGRLYFSDLQGLRVLAMGILIGGLLYVPLCLFEIRMSPRLHIWVYGWHQHSWAQAHGLFGWRPTVFMQHGLAVAFWMVAASIVGFWTWWTGSLRRIGPVPSGYVVTALIITAVLCGSAGALALLVAGLTSLLAISLLRTKLVAWCLIALPLIYMASRGPGLWDAQILLDAVDAIAPAKRESLEYRLSAEEILAEHALRQPVFGWGGFGRNRPSRLGYDVRDIATDGLWIITLGKNGIVGLSAMVVTMALPVLRTLRRLRAKDWNYQELAPLSALAIILSLFMIDCLLNAMLNPVYLLAAGGLVAALSAKAPVARPVSQQMSDTGDRSSLHLAHSTLWPGPARRLGS